MTQIRTRNYTNAILCLFVFLFAWFSVAGEAWAAGATFSITPASGEFSVGSNISATISLHTGGNLINAAEGTINFSPEFLRVISISKSGSVFSLWPVEPTFDNASGILSFGGGISAAFSGPSGTVLKVIFSVKKTGEGAISFSGGRILAADGAGTNVFAGSQGAGWKFVLAKVVAPAEKITGLPEAPVISSPTHPDPNKWYSNSNPKFTWTLPKDATAVHLLVSKVSQAVPTVTYTPAIKEKELKNMEDGAWYFHAQFRNANGWGEISHFRFQIDTQPPEPFSIEFLDGKETTKPQPRIEFSTEDKVSGIAGYQMKIGEGDWFDPQILKTGSYVLPVQALGERLLLVLASDKAGNTQEAGDKFVILPEMRLLPPIIITFPLILLGILLFIAFILIGYLGYRLRKLKRKISLETHEAGAALHKAFDLLREDIREQIKMLEKTRTKRKLTEEEEKIIKLLKKDLDEAEKFVKKEIEDIEKEVK